MNQRAFEDVMREGGSVALAHLGKFFMKTDSVHDTMRRIVARLNELGIPHAVAGGMALVGHGYDRSTVDVDLLVGTDGVRRVHEALSGLGYVPPFPGSKNLRDVQSSVRIEFLVEGQFPGDGKPKPVAFPNPEAAGQVIDGIRYVRLPVLIELKLASGMTNAGRLKDLADVQELIRTLKLGEDFAQQLNPYVREKFAELWRGVQQDVNDHGSP